jgi:hypothetical protein
MDPTKEKTTAELLSELKDEVSNPGNYSGTMTSGMGYDTISLSAIKSITDEDSISLTSDTTYSFSLDDSTNVGTGFGINYPNTMSVTGGPYTIGSGSANIGIGLNPWATNSAKIQLDGEDADIKINGWSLIAAVKRIEERLDILTPNPELESEWAELKRLGDRYKKLEKKIQDKMATWDRLNAMPKIHID